MLAIVLYVFAIAFCGVTGAAAGWLLADAIGLSGTPGAIASTVIAMAVAVALWAAGVAVSNRLRR